MIKLILISTLIALAGCTMSITSIEGNGNATETAIVKETGVGVDAAIDGLLP